MPSKKPNQRGTESNKLHPPTRRGSKPQVEKKRRARINKSLAELQALIIDGEMAKNQMKNRIEKADILEKTVAHIKSMRERDNHSPNQLQVESSPPSTGNENSVHRFPLNKFNMGYMECAAKASQYLLEEEKVDKGLNNRLKSHLMFVYKGINLRNETPSSPPISLSPSNDEDSSDSSSPSRDAGLSSECDDSERLQAPKSPPAFTPEHQNQIVQLIPGRLSNGEFAFLLPHKGLEMFSKLSERDLAFRPDSQTYNPFQPNYSAPSYPLYNNSNAYSEFAERQRQLFTMNGSDPRHSFNYPPASYLGRPGWDFGKHWRPW